MSNPSLASPLKRDRLTNDPNKLSLSTLPWRFPSLTLRTTCLTCNHPPAMIGNIIVGSRCLLDHSILERKYLCRDETVLSRIYTGPFQRRYFLRDNSNKITRFLPCCNCHLVLVRVLLLLAILPLLLLWCECNRKEEGFNSSSSSRRPNVLILLHPRVWWTHQGLHSNKQEPRTSSKH